MPTERKEEAAGKVLNSSSKSSKPSWTARFRRKSEEHQQQEKKVRNKYHVAAGWWFLCTLCECIVYMVYVREGYEAIGNKMATEEVYMLFIWSDKCYNFFL